MAVVYNPLIPASPMVKKTGSRRVLITGGTGFVGSHLAHAISQRDSVVVVYRHIYPQSYFFLEKLKKNVTLIRADIRNSTGLLRIVKSHRITHIIHTAAMTDVSEVLEKPQEAISINIEGTVSVLEAARNTATIRGILIASTDKVYGKSLRNVREDSPLSGDHPYEVSKAAADRIAYAYAKSYGLPIVITRFGNIYGPGDPHTSRIIPSIMRAAITREPIILRSDGSFVRDYVYVRDAVSAYVFLLNRVKRVCGEVFNVSSYDCLSVVELIGIAKKVLRVDIPYRVGRTQRNEIPRQHLLWNKVRNLGWKPGYRIEEGLQETYQWYKTHATSLR